MNSGPLSVRRGRRTAVERRELAQDPRHAPTGERHAHGDLQAFSIALVDDGQQPDSPPVVERLGHEVERPGFGSTPAARSTAVARGGAPVGSSGAADSAAARSTRDGGVCGSTAAPRRAAGHGASRSPTADSAPRRPSAPQSPRHPGDSPAPEAGSNAVRDSLTTRQARCPGNRCSCTSTSASCRFADGPTIFGAGHP